MFRSQNLLRNPNMTLFFYNEKNFEKCKSKMASYVFSLYSLAVKISKIKISFEIETRIVHI